MSSIIKEVVIVRTKLQKQKGEIDSKLCPGIHIVCNLLSRRAGFGILTIQ